MLPYALAIVVGLSSLILFSTAFFMSDAHRQDDFFWSGVGLFYALVLWFCATRITGGLLLGQAAAVALLVSYNWQTLKLRKAIANPERAAELNNFSVIQAVGNMFNRRPKSSVKPTVTTTQTATPEADKTTIATPDTLERGTPEVTREPVSNVEESVIPQVTETVSNLDNNETSIEPETMTPPVATETATTTPQPEKKGLFGKLFNLGKEKPTAITNTKLDEIFDDEELLEEDFEEETVTTTPQPTEKTNAEATIAENPKITEVESESVSIKVTPETVVSPSTSGDEEVVEVTIEKIEIKLTPEALAEEGKIDEILSLAETPVNNDTKTTEDILPTTQDTSIVEEAPESVTMDKPEAKTDPNSDLADKPTDTSEIDEFLADLEEKNDSDRESIVKYES